MDFIFVRLLFGFMQYFWKNHVGRSFPHQGKMRKMMEENSEIFP
jgi:hypothetical protein